MTETGQVKTEEDKGFSSYFYYSPVLDCQA